MKLKGKDWSVLSNESFIDREPNLYFKELKLVSLFRSMQLNTVAECLSGIERVPAS
jgi:hypothetical protein